MTQLKKNKLNQLFVSDLCLGCSSIENKILKKYFDYGGNFLDTAPVYQDGESEKIIGKFGHRSELIIGTKIGLCKDYGGLSEYNINKSINESLKRLNTDYIDILWVHVWDGTLGFEKCLFKLLKSGKIRTIGACNTPAWVISMYRDLFKVIQIEYNFNNRSSDIELVPMAKNLNIPIIARSIFDKGKIFKTWPFIKKSLLTIQWLKSKNFLPIIRTNKIKNLQDNIKDYYENIPLDYLKIVEKSTFFDNKISPYDFINSNYVKKLISIKNIF